MISEENMMYSIRNVQQRKGRSALTIFSILVGIATIFIFVSFGYGLYNYTNEMTTSSSADKLMIAAKGGSMPGLDTTIKLTDDDLEAIEKSDGVLEASGVYFTTVQAESNNQLKYTFLISYDPKSPLILEMFNDLGADEGRLLLPNDNGKVVLGYNYKVANKIFEKPLEVNDNIEVNGEKLKIVGFFESIGNPQDDSQIYVTNDYFKELFPNASYAEIIARAEIDSIDKTIENIEKKLRKERGLEEGKEDFYVQSFDDMIESFKSVLNIIVGFVILIALISVLVSAINTANTMITSVLERYKEIGILKAIGARNKEILTIFLFESAFLGTIAGILGVLLGWIATSIAGSVLTSLGWGFLQPYYSIELFVGCILFATITGAISGVAPAIKASKINTVDALRYE